MEGYTEKEGKGEERRGQKAVEGRGGVRFVDERSGRLCIGEKKRKGVEGRGQEEVKGLEREWRKIWRGENSWKEGRRPRKAWN